MSTEFYWIAVAVVTILASARITRLAVYDDFPPVKWVRDKYLEATDGSNWQLLGICGYCFSFWVTLTVVAWADLSGIFEGPTSDPNLWASGWWFFMGAFGASYLAAAFVANDGDSTADDTDDDESGAV